MKRQLAALALGLVLTYPATALAADDEAPGTRERAEEMARDAEEMAREAAERLMTMLRLILAAVPQYEAPEILDNGDIIIRRKQPSAEDPESPDSPAAPPTELDIDETST